MTEKGLNPSWIVVHDVPHSNTFNLFAFLWFLVFESKIRPIDAKCTYSSCKPSLLEYIELMGSGKAFDMEP